MAKDHIGRSHLQVIIIIRVSIEPESGFVFAGIWAEKGQGMLAGGYRVSFCSSEAVPA